MYVECYAKPEPHVSVYRAMTHVCDLVASTRYQADKSLAILGWRRREKWQQTPWGWTAKLRRKER